MQEPNEQQNVDQSPDSRLSMRQPMKVCLCLMGVAVLLNVAMASAALNYLVPKMVNGKRGIATRVNWYLHNQQWQADTRTLTAALDYIMATDRDASIITNVSNLPVAENAAPSTPKS